MFEFQSFRVSGFQSFMSINHYSWFSYHDRNPSFSGKRFANLRKKSVQEVDNPFSSEIAIPNCSVDGRSSLEMQILPSGSFLRVAGAQQERWNPKT
ncbi:hypothetical protein K0M31_011479 [Melipona bicolor]|uniref:Uncharacterized protein n=1 Tax=Melipona bicolor TaxID=60889 RepID=A0AA40KUN4_9HYME|nr:hypothetical protein K0M31_011479 [Melipona bicolor]